MIDLAWSAWAVLVVAALLIGLAKTALPGLATLSVALFAAVLPARSSTAVMLCLLLVGDLIAVWTYRRDVDWDALRRLIPAVVVGLAAGAVLLALADDVLMRRIIDKCRVGVILDRPCWNPARRALDLERLLSPFYPTWDRARFAGFL